MTQGQMILLSAAWIVIVIMGMALVIICKEITKLEGVLRTTKEETSMFIRGVNSRMDGLTLRFGDTDRDIKFIDNMEKIDNPNDYIWIDGHVKNDMKISPLIWQCTIRGVITNVPSNYIRILCLTLEDAITAVNPEEFDWLQINYGNKKTDQ